MVSLLVTSHYVSSSKQAKFVEGTRNEVNFPKKLFVLVGLCPPHKHGCLFLVLVQFIRYNTRLCITGHPVYNGVMKVELRELKEKESTLSSFPTSELAVLAGVNPAQKLPGKFFSSLFPKKHLFLFQISRYVSWYIWFLRIHLHFFLSTKTMKKIAIP